MAELAVGGVGGEVVVVLTVGVVLMVLGLVIVLDVLVQVFLELVFGGLHLH